MFLSRVAMVKHAVPHKEHGFALPIYISLFLHSPFCSSRSLGDLNGQILKRRKFVRNENSRKIVASTSENCVGNFGVCYYLFCVVRTEHCF